jgi:hypothetical protein
MVDAAHTGLDRALDQFPPSLHITVFNLHILRITKASRGIFGNSNH